MWSHCASSSLGARGVPAPFGPWHAKQFPAAANRARPCSTICWVTPVGSGGGVWAWSAAGKAAEINIATPRPHFEFGLISTPFDSHVLARTSAPAGGYAGGEESVSGYSPRGRSVPRTPGGLRQHRRYSACRRGQ